MIPDLFQSLGSRFNFSVFHLFVSDWGVVPLEKGPFQNNTFVGAMGAVIHGGFDLSLSSWLAVPERSPLLDMEPTYIIRNVMAIVPKPLKVDLKFFQHPFSIEAWQGILLVAFLICVTIIPPSLLLGNYENTDAYNWASLSAWSFFLLINSFYGGALTMFFSTKAAPPFSQFHEVVQAYPTWILKTLAGTDVYFNDKAECGDPDFKAFYERMVQNPEETTFTNIGHVLRTMEEEYIVILADFSVLQSSFQMNLDFKAHIEILGTMRESWTNVILKKHSPLSPIVRKGLNSLRDYAVMEKTRAKWIGQGVPKSTEISAYTLGLGQTLLVYLTTLIACILSLMILGLEHLFARFYSS
ncbi:hypothetical protein TCAL_08548 [Tigriopus californicus]|uniref:Ionotropic glutamate receptor C-terminal domain-containing protein n=3 Tax=Tigriopus californicus TaxID=6832 RepID=A0A553PIE5_TIGCA|nr:hypothetical protein TCAL_08548 [Tigriopus californicus]